MFVATKILAVLASLLACVCWLSLITYSFNKVLRSDFDLKISRSIGKVGKAPRILLHCLRIVFVPKTLFYVAMFLFWKQKH